MDDDDVTPRRTDSQRIVQLEQVLMPRNAFEAHLQQQIDDLRGDVSTLKSSRRFWIWMAGLGIPALLAAAFAALLWSADKIATSAERVGRTEAKIEALGKLIDLLEEDVTELRRHAGLDMHGVSGGRVGTNP